MDDETVSIPSWILGEFEAHSANLRKASAARKEAVALRNIVEDKKDRETISVADTLGRRQPEDVYEGDCNLRTLRLLLKMIDERGWERCVLNYAHMHNFCFYAFLCLVFSEATTSSNFTVPSKDASLASCTRTSGRRNAPRS